MPNGWTWLVTFSVPVFDAGGHVVALSVSDASDVDVVPGGHSEDLFALSVVLPSQRKVIYACLKKNLEKDMKVAQLSGYDFNIV